MVNKVILIGNLGRDPEDRTTPSGQRLVKFSLATSRRRKGQDGERIEETEWHNIVVWGRLAEVAAQYLRKGSKLYVEGRIQTRSWDDEKTNTKKYMTEIICENFQMLSSRAEMESMRSAAEPSSGGGGYGPADDDDIPF